MHAQTRIRPVLYRIALLLALTLVVQPTRAASTDWTQALADEPRLASQLRWLESGQEKVLTLYRANQAPVQRGTVILLHDLRTHADWPRVIGPLREQLPDHGWSTWSLQLPSPPNDVDTDQYLQECSTRLAAALSAVTEQSDQPVLLLGVGTGASTALRYLAQNPKSPVRGLVVVSLRPLQGQSLEDIGTLMNSVEVPVLEVYAERDHRNVLRGIEQRRSLAAPRPAENGPIRDQPGRYRQVIMEGADADYSGQTEALTKRIRGWMHVLTDR